MWIFNRNLGALLAAGVLLWGCGDRGSGTTPGAVAASVATRKAKPADTLSRYMVGAVAADKSGSIPVQLKFELKERPDIAQPLDVDLAIVPMSGSVDRVSGKITAEDGLEVLAGADIPPTDRPAEGVAIPHTLKVLPKRDGIFSLNAVLTVDSGADSSTATFSIPVIAGAGFADLPGAPAAGAAPLAKGANATASAPAATH
jgi:hypothetical protein